MIEHFVVPIFSDTWWAGIVFSIFFIGIPIIFGKLLPEKSQNRFGFFIGILLLATALSVHPYMAYEGIWDLRSSLPLQLCALSGFLSGIAFFYRNQIVYELLIYWGIPGAFHSLLTPEMSLGGSSFIVAEFYVAHAGILLSALYLTFVSGMKPREHSWFKIFLYTQLLLLAVGGINLLLDANYMYLCKKPIANNPLVIGDWPLYVLILDLAGLIHFFIIYLLYKFTGNLKKVQINSTFSQATES